MRELIRRRMAVSAGGSMSEVYQPFAVGELASIPADVEDRLYQRIDETLKRYRRVILPASIQAEFEALPNIIEPIAQTHNDIVDYIVANMYVPSGRIMSGLIELQRLYVKYSDMLRRRAQYLHKPMPSLTPLKTLPFVIISAVKGRFRRALR